MAQAPDVCATCYGTNLVLQGGFLTCADCGTQAQTILEETEYGDAAQGRARRSIRAPRAAGTGAPDDSLAQQLQGQRRAAEGAALLYARCLQALARQQARALHERLGAHADVETLVRQLWLPTVAASGVLEPGIVERQVAVAPSANNPPLALSLSRVAARRRQDDGEAQEDEEDGAAAAAAAPTTTNTRGHRPRHPTNLQHEKVLETRPEALQRRLGAALPAQTTLAVAFAALALAREPVVPADVIAWALGGALPFVELPTVAAGLLRRAAEGRDEEQGQQDPRVGARAGRAGGGGASAAAAGGAAAAAAAAADAAAAAALATGALHAQVTWSPAQLAERAEEVVALALRDPTAAAAAVGRQRQHALPPANGEALLRRLGRELAAAAVSGAGTAPCPAAVSLACELHDMYLLGTPSLAFVRDSVLFGFAAGAANGPTGAGAAPASAAVAGPWAPGAGPPRPTTAAAAGAAGAQEQEIAILVPTAGGGAPHQQQQQQLLRVPLAVVASGGGGGGGGTAASAAGADGTAAGPTLPTWVGQGMGRHAHPFAAVAAALVVALKLLHGSLEGKEEEEEEEEEDQEARQAGGSGRARQQGQSAAVLPGPKGGWQLWASRAVSRGPQPHAGPEEEEDGGGRSSPLPRSAKARRAFLLAARRHAFAGSGPPEALEDVQRVLLMLAQVEEEEVQGREGAGGEQEQEEEDEEGLERLPRSGGGGNNNKRRRRRGFGGEDPRAARQQQPPQQPQPEAATTVSASAADGRYLLAGDAATARAPPEYVAVLAAVAAHAHTDPFTLHALVRQLERRMLAAESSLLVLASLS